MLALVDPLSSQRTDNWFGSRKSPSHSDDQLQQMLDDILPAGPNIQDLCDDVLDKAWSGAQQLTAACLAPALPVNSAAVSDHEAAMVAISRALSQTLLHHGGAGDIFDSIQAPQVDALPSWAGVACGNLPEMSVQEFRSLAAEFLDIGGTAAEGRRSNDAPANNAAQSWPAESAGYTANAMRTLSADLMDAYQAWEAQSGEASDALSAQPSFLCTLDRAPAGRGSVEVDSAAVSMDYVSDSGQLSGSSETSDARSGSLQQAQPDLAAQCVAASAAAYSAAPAAAPGQILNSNLQHGGVVRPGSGSAPGGDTPRGGHRQGGRISADPQSRLERNRKLQKDYVQRKRVSSLGALPKVPAVIVCKEGLHICLSWHCWKEPMGIRHTSRDKHLVLQARIDVTHSLADSLRSRVASLTADIGALQKKQDELLSAQTHQVGALQKLLFQDVSQAHTCKYLQCQWQGYNCMLRVWTVDQMTHGIWAPLPRRL